MTGKEIMLLHLVNHREKCKGYIVEYEKELCEVREEANALLDNEKAEAIYNARKTKAPSSDQMTQEKEIVKFWLPKSIEFIRDMVLKDFRGCSKHNNNPNLMEFSEWRRAESGRLMERLRFLDEEITDLRSDIYWINQAIKQKGIEPCKKTVKRS